MASSATLQIFNPEAESVDYYMEHFDFHCMAHDIAQQSRKTLFTTSHPHTTHPRMGWLRIWWRTLSIIFKKHKPTNVSLCLPDFLWTYCNTPHTVTNRAPAHLILLQAPRTHLSMFLPSVCQRVKLHLQPTPKQTARTVHKFQVGDAVISGHQPQLNGNMAPS